MIAIADDNPGEPEGVIRGLGHADAQAKPDGIEFSGPLARTWTALPEGVGQAPGVKPMAHQPGVRLVDLAVGCGAGEVAMARGVIPDLDAKRVCPAKEREIGQRSLVPYVPHRAGSHEIGYGVDGGRRPFPNERLDAIGKGRDVSIVEGEANAAARPLPGQIPRSEKPRASSTEEPQVREQPIRLYVQSAALFSQRSHLVVAKDRQRHGSVLP